MNDLVREGKVAHIGLSEVSQQTLERACKVASVAALQSEYSLWSRDIEAGTLEACRRLGVALVAYSPLGRGFLTGYWKAAEPGTSGDLRQFLPRFQPGNVEPNLRLLEVLRDLARELSCTPAQVALAWVLSSGQHIHAIPGSTKSKNLADNFASLQVQLTPTQRERLSSTFSTDAIHGGRYPEALLKTVNV